MDKRFSRVAAATKAKWWQLQFRGLVSYFAAFIGCSMLIMRALAPINNGGARKIMNVARNFNISFELQRVQSEFNICVQTFYCKCVVGYVGHCFRHSSHPISKLMSLPLAERLTSLRSQSRRVPSQTAEMARDFLSSLGFSVGPLVAGRPDVRGQSGYVFRWGEGWFEEIRDSGPGWLFVKNDKPAVEYRVNLLLDIFRPRRGSGLPPLMDLMQVAISDEPQAPI